MFASCIPVWGGAAAEPSLGGFRVVGQDVSASFLRVWERGGLLAPVRARSAFPRDRTFLSFRSAFFKTASLCSRQGSRLLISTFCSCKYRCGSGLWTLWRGGSWKTTRRPKDVILLVLEVLGQLRCLCGTSAGALLKGSGELTCAGKHQ